MGFLRWDLGFLYLFGLLRERQSINKIKEPASHSTQAIGSSILPCSIAAQLIVAGWLQRLFAEAAAAAAAVADTPPSFTALPPATAASSAAAGWHWSLFDLSAAMGVTSAVVETAPDCQVCRMTVAATAE